MNRFTSTARGAALSGLLLLSLSACQTRPVAADFVPNTQWTPPPLVVYKPLPLYLADKPDVPASYLVLLPDDNGSTGRVRMASGAAEPLELSRPQDGAGLGGGAAFAVSDYQVQRDFGAVLAARPPRPETYQLYFEPGRAELNADARQALRDVLARARRFNYLEVSVLGHTDSRGDAKANQALARRRADQVRELLLAQGLKPTQIEVAAQGESHPQVPTADNVSEARNRRVEVVLR